MSSEESQVLAVALVTLSKAVDRQTQVLEVLVAGMKPSTEAAILGVSTRTVTRRRKERQFRRMVG